MNDELAVPVVVFCYFPFAHFWCWYLEAEARPWKKMQRSLAHIMISLLFDSRHCSHGSDALPQERNFGLVVIASFSNRQDM